MRLFSLVLVLLGGLSLALIVVLLHGREAARLEHLGDALSTRIQADVEALTAALDRLASGKPLRRSLHDAPPRVPWLEPALRDVLQRELGLSSLRLVEAGGEVFAQSTGPSAANGLDAAVVALARRSVDARQPMLSHPRADRGRSHLLLAVPVHLEDRSRRWGTVVAEIDQQRLFGSRLGMIEAPFRAEILLAGEPAVESRRRTSDAVQRARWQLPMLADMADATAPAPAGQIAGPFELVLTIPLTQVYRDAIACAAGYLLLSALLLAVVRHQARQTASELIGPLARLEGAARAVLRNGLSALPDLASGERAASAEVASLAASFEGMLARLHDAQANLARKVDERTRELTDAKERLDTTLSSLQDGVYSISPDADRLLFASEPVGRMLSLHRPAEPMVAATMRALLDDVQFEAWRQAIDTAWDRGSLVQRYEIWVGGVDDGSGGTRWIEDRLQAVRDAHGHPLRIDGILRDITAEVRARQARDDDYARLSTVFALSPDGFVTFDGRDRVALVNPAFERLTRQPAAHWLDLTRKAFDERLAALRAPVPADLLSSHWRQVAEAQGDTEAELQILRGTPERIVLCSARACDAPDLKRVMHWRDITTESEVDRMKGQFLSVAAHELRTPMTSIYGFVELLISRQVPPERQRSLLTTVHRQCEAMIAILNDVLDLARIEARRGADFVLAEADLAACTAECIADFAPPEGRASPVLQTSADAVDVRVDRGKFAQVLRNLLSNAFKYSPDGGEVTVTVERAQHGGRVMAGVAVRDHGIGMSPESAARAFERFFRADDSGRIPGTGLGLSLVREIVGVMGGDVTLDTVLGQGTCVTVWLPLRIAGAMPRPGGIAETPPEVQSSAAAVPAPAPCAPAAEAA